jgi:hypothetical protein
MSGASPQGGCDEPQQTFSQSDHVDERYRIGGGCVGRLSTGCSAVLFRQLQVEEKKDVFLQVVEQIRLVVDVPEAVVPLR